MPKREDIQTILVIGSGPIVTGQACEFDYSGAQACKVLKADGYRVVLVNSNPATIMTDPGLADRTYVEPITVEFVEQVIAKERPDALLPTLGGQTGLNTAVELARAGILAKYGVEMIGCDLEAIERGEDRKQFNECMAELGIETSRSGYAYSIADAEDIVAELGYPVVLRPSFTLGGAGGGIAHDAAELHEIVGQGLELSPAGEVLVEESIEGWKEYEMEVMRDRAGNGIIVCSIENFDAMGVHTGDSITVAPAQTLTDVEYQRMRAASLAILEKIGVETGGSNVQFAVNPENGRMIVIEMNPRVSRSSALASKATGFPIAKAAAKLAVGYTLDEIVNDITKATPACFEPSIDYCVVKVPRFAFEKFQGTDDTLSTRMKAVGEVMAIGRTFEESLGKAMRWEPTARAARPTRPTRRWKTSWRAPRPSASSTWPRRCAAAGRSSARARRAAWTPSSSRAWPTSCACRKTCAAWRWTSSMPTRSACSSAWGWPTRRSRASRAPTSSPCARAARCWA